MQNDSALINEEREEYEFNLAIRNQKLPKSMPIPIVSMENIPCWARLKMILWIPSVREQSLISIWTKFVYFFHEIIGFVRMGERKKENFYTISISSDIDLFERIDFYEMQANLEQEIQCKTTIEELICK